MLLLESVEQDTRLGRDLGAVHFFWLFFSAAARGVGGADG